MSNSRDYTAPRHTNDSPIAQARISRGMTQAQLAEAIGVKQQQVGQWENGGRNPKMDALMRIGAALGVDWTTLIGGAKMNLQKVIYRSETYIEPAHVLGSGWAQIHAPEKKKRRYFITNIYDNGAQETMWTNGDGEGLFSTDRNGGEYQITGLSQFGIPGTTPAAVKRNIINSRKRDIDDGVEIEFDLSDF